MPYSIHNPQTDDFAGFKVTSPLGEFTGGGGEGKMRLEAEIVSSVGETECGVDRLIASRVEQGDRLDSV